MATPFDFYKINDFFTAQECLDIKEIFKKYPRIDNIDIPADNKKNKIINTKWEKLKLSVNKLYETALEINQFHFGYNLFPFTDHTILNMNTYEKGDAYGWHRDGSNSHCFDYKLTVLANISTEEYEGGDFEIFLNGIYEDKTILKNPGSVFIFKSHISHRVTPLIKGQRNSLSFWLTGPKIV